MQYLFGRTPNNNMPLEARVASRVSPRRGNLWVILRASARSTEEPVKLPTGGIKGALERLFRFQGVDEGSTLIIDAVVENLLDAFPSQRGIFVDIADDLPA